MKRNLMICIALAVIFSFASCDSESALDFVITPSNGDPTSCLLNLTYAIQPNKIVFTVDRYIPDPSNPDCTYQDIVTAPIFYSVPFTPKNLNLTASASNPNHFTATFTTADLKAALGKSCFYAGVYNTAENPASRQVYTCRFKWSSIYLYFDFWMVLPYNNTFENVRRVLFTEIASTKRSTMYGINVWIPDPTFPNIIGRIEDGCGMNNWDNVVNSLSTHLTVTGTQYLSNTFDLHPYFNGVTNYNVLSLKNGGNAQNYLDEQLAANFGELAPFNEPSPGNCTDIGITYGDFLPNLNYCGNGCAVSLLLYTDVQQFILTTNGIHTSSYRLRA